MAGINDRRIAFIDRLLATAVPPFSDRRTAIRRPVFGIAHRIRRFRNLQKSR